MMKGRFVLWILRCAQYAKNKLNDKDFVILSFR